MTSIDSPPPVNSQAKPDAPTSALECCVGDPTVFADEYWSVRPLLRRAAAHANLAGLLDVDTIEQLLADTLRRPAFRLVRDGSTLPAVQSTRRVRIGGRVVDDAADVDRIAAAIAGGASLVMQSLERHWAPLNAFCADLQRELGHPVQANAYLTPPGAAGLHPHRDRHDVIVVQLDGSKNWEVEGLGEIELVAGDVLYLPAGTEHRASTGATMSLHVTLGLLAVTAREVAQRFVDGAGGWLDRPLPLRFGERSEALAATVEQVRADLIATIAAADSSAIADGLRSLATSKQLDRLRVTGRLRLAADPGDIAATTVVERRAGTVLSAREDGSDAVVDLVGYRLRLPRFTLEALEYVAGHETFRVGDLPGLDDADAVVLVRRLVREGVLTPVSRWRRELPPHRGRT